MLLLEQLLQHEVFILDSASFWRCATFGSATLYRLLVGMAALEHLGGEPTFYEFPRAPIVRVLGRSMLCGHCATTMSLMMVWLLGPTLLRGWNGHPEWTCLDVRDLLLCSIQNSLRRLQRRRGNRGWISWVSRGIDQEVVHLFLRTPDTLVRIQPFALPAGTRVGMGPIYHDDAIHISGLLDLVRLFLASQSGAPLKHIRGKWVVRKDSGRIESPAYLSCNLN
jgi:hypothetical protein